MSKKIELIDGGSVALLSISGDDRKVDARARASFVGAQEEERTDEQVTNLIRHLMRNRHTSPFEFVVVEYAVHCPLFVFNQLARHRTAAINAASGRYGSLTELPVLDPPLAACTREGASRQKSSSELCDNPRTARDLIHKHGVRSKDLEFELIHGHGMSHEMARSVLPQNQSTSFFYQMNLHNLLHLFSLRLNVTGQSHAQAYTVDYVRAMADLVKPHIPIIWEAWHDYVASSMTFHRRELAYMANDLIPLMRKCVASDSFSDGLSKGEMRDFLSKLERLERCST